jgi:leader peptidase (prepilin peptidase)/N-methyltransferase
MIELIGISLFSAILGSVANMLIYRLPNNRPVFWGRSRCIHCQQVLGIFDLIPIVSYLSLKGRCHFCLKNISSRYLWVEIIVVSIAIYSYLSLGWTIAGLKLFLFAYVSTLLFFIDMETQLLPLSLNICLILGGLVFNLEYDLIRDSVIAGCLGFSILWLLRWITSLIYKMETIGFGDLFLLAGVGSFWGIQAMLVSIHAGLIVGGITGLGLLMIKKAKKTDYLAFGPFIIIGFWINHFFGHAIVTWLYG